MNSGFSISDNQSSYNETRRVHVPVNEWLQSALQPFAAHPESPLWMGVHLKHEHKTSASHHFQLALLHVRRISPLLSPSFLQKNSFLNCQFPHDGSKEYCC